MGHRCLIKKKWYLIFTIKKYSSLNLNDQLKVCRKDSEIKNIYNLIFNFSSMTVFSIKLLAVLIWLILWSQTSEFINILHQECGQNVDNERGGNVVPLSYNCNIYYQHSIKNSFPDSILAINFCNTNIGLRQTTWFNLGIVYWYSESPDRNLLNVLLAEREREKAH